MMNAHLSTWLVAGGIVFVCGHLGFVPSNMAPTESINSNRRPAVVAAHLEATDELALVSIQVPGFRGKPAIQVLSSPARLVVDLPGVNRGNVPRGEIAKLSHPFILKARMAQFEQEPRPVTRLVLELVPSIKAVVSTEPHGVDIALRKGVGKIQASLVENSFPAVEAQPSIVPDTYVDPQMIMAATNPDRQQIADDLPPIFNNETSEGTFALYSNSVERLPQIGSPYVGLPSLSSMPIMPLAATQVQRFVSSIDPKYPTASNARDLVSMESKFTGTAMSINVSNADIRSVVMGIAATAGLNLIIDPDANSGGHTFDFNDVPWDQILDHVVNSSGLAYKIENGVLRVAKIEKFSKEAADRKALEDANLLAGDLVTVSNVLSYAKVDDAQKILTNIKSDRGKIFTDTRTNLIVLTDLPKYIDLMQQLLKQLDINIPQVQIEARIVEATRGWQKAFGTTWPQTGSGQASLQVGGQGAPWGAQNGPSWNSINSRSANGNNSTTVAFSPGKEGTGIVSPAAEVWVSFLTNRMSMNAIIQAMESNSLIKVVSEPKLISQNNSKAHISDGSRIPYQSTQGGLAGGAITVTFVEAELKLEVTPRITNSGTIILEVDIEKSSPNFQRSVNGTPSIDRKQLKNTVIVEDGGTVILGGVFTNSVGNGGTGVPFLSKLPGLGWLFRSKTSEDNTTEMLVMISPKIMTY